MFPKVYIKITMEEISGEVKSKSMTIYQFYILKTNIHETNNKGIVGKQENT